MAVTEQEPSGEVGFLANLFDHFRDLVGEAAACTSLRYAAYQEGKRIGQGHRLEDLPALARRLDAILGHNSDLRSEGKVISCTVEGDERLSAGHPLTEAVTLGLLEGALQVVTGRPLRARRLNGKTHADAAAPVTAAQQSVSILLEVPHG